MLKTWKKRRSTRFLQGALLKRRRQAIHGNNCHSRKQDLFREPNCVPAQKTIAVFFALVLNSKSYLRARRETGSDNAYIASPARFHLCPHQSTRPTPFCFTWKSVLLFIVYVIVISPCEKFEWKKILRAELESLWNWSNSRLSGFCCSTLESQLFFSAYSRNLKACW